MILTCLNNCHFSTTIKNTFRITTLFLLGRIMKQSKIKRHNHPFSQKSQAQGISPSLSPSRVSELLHLHGHCSTQLLQHCSPSTPALGSADSCSQSQPRYSVGFSSTHTHSPIALRLLFYSPFPVSRVLWSFLLFSLPVSSLEAGDPSTK